MLISRKNISSTELQKFGKPFLRLDIEKYMSLLGQTPIAPQIALVNAINCPDYRFVVATLSRRTGKTHISNIIGQLVVLVPGTQILIIAPNYSLSTISWDLQRQLIRNFDLETERSNAKDRIIELTNGSMIRIGSVSQPDAVVGRSYDLIIFDEAALNDDGWKVFNIQLRPTLDKANSKAIFISTPRGKNWFYDFYQRGFNNDEFSDWCSILSTYRDNPRVDINDIERARLQLSKAEFAQEYECDFVAQQGKIWNFNLDNIISSLPSDLEVIDRICGLDLGFRDPTAFCVIYTDGKNFYIVDEYLQAESSTDVHGRSLRDQIDKHGIDFVYIDSANQQTRFDLSMTWDIATVNATKSINDGLGYVASLCDHDRIYVLDTCTNVIDTFNNYRWDDREGLISEKPLHDKYCHMADAIRYAIYSHAMNVEGIIND